MKRLRLCALILTGLFAAALPGRGQPRSDIREVSGKKYIAPGNIWKGETVTVTEALDMDRESAIFSNAETPGHGKIHANILSDSKGNIWTAGYMGSSYDHEFANAYYPKSYAGGAIVKYDPRTRNTEYYGVPAPFGGTGAMYLDEKRNTVHG